MNEIIARREFLPIYIWLDVAFLVLLAALLIWKKKYMTVFVGIGAGLLYMIVDYGIFHLITGSRSISEGHSMFWVLLWMSMSYGFTNFVWIWLWLSKDKHLFEWSTLILMWWFVCPLLATSFAPADMQPIVIQRTTGAYHGYMALIMILGYIGAIFYNLWQKEKSKRINIPWILAIGILVQLGWEVGLLLGGIRSAGFDVMTSLHTLVVNSLLETNLGMPTTYLLFIFLTSRFTEQARKREKISLIDRIKENNLEKVKGE